MTVKSADAEPLWVGLDVGTSGVRALAVGADGVVHGEGRSPLTSTRPAPGHHEQDPEAWWAAACASLRQALAGLPRDAVAGIAVAATSGTVLVQDDRGRSRGPALMYDDTRAAAHAARAQEAGQAVWERLGQRIQPSWALPRVLWLLAEGVIGPHDRVVHQGDHLASRLTGGPVATDWTTALKTGYDTVGLSWPEEALAALGLDAARLPEVVAPGSRIGQVGEQGARETALPVGTPVHAGATDGCAAQVAGGALTTGSWTSSLGTTLIVKGVSDTALRDPDGAVYNHRAPDGAWWPGGASSAGAGVLGTVLPGTDSTALSALTRDLPDFPVAGFCYPTTGPGERFPFASTLAVPVLPDGPPAARLAAVMQAVAFVERLAYDVLGGLGADRSGDLALTGGATANRRWSQLRCDVLGREAVIPRSPEPALGAAILAVADGEGGDLATTAARMVSQTARLTPDAEAVERLDPAYRQFVATLVERDWLDADRVAEVAR